MWNTTSCRRLGHETYVFGCSREAFGGSKISRRLSELKKTVLSMLSAEHGDLPEKIIDSMIEIVARKEEEEKKKRAEAIRRRVEDLIKRAEKDIHERYSAKIEALETIKIHIKKGEYDKARSLLESFYLQRKPAPRKRAPQPAEEPKIKVEPESLEELKRQAPDDVLGQLAQLLSVSEEEAEMYALELSAAFERATGFEITPEKAAECYLKFRNWDFKRTWLPSLGSGLGKE